MKKITELTEEQKAMMKSWVEKWIKIGLSCEEADWELSEKSIRECYFFAGLDQPKSYIRVKSPYILSLAAPIANFIISNSVTRAVDSSVYRAVDRAVTSSVDSAVGSEVYRAVGSEVGSAIDSAVDSLVDSLVFRAVDRAVYRAVGSEVYRAVYRAVGSEVGSAIDSAVDSLVDSLVFRAVDRAVYRAVGSEVGSAVDSSVGSLVDMKKYIINNYSNYFGGQFWVSWQAYESFFNEICGLKLEGDLSERAKSYRNAQMSSGWWFPAKDFVMVCDRPEHIYIENGQLHSSTRLAIQWRDGWGIAMWKGIRIPNEWIVDRKPTAKELLEWENIEQRRCGFELIGWDKLLYELDAKTIDKNSNEEIGELIEINLPNSGKERFLKVRCGTGRFFVLPVEPSCKTALDAQAWSYGFNKNEFNIPEIRT
jgi:hypothetical protein